MSSYCGRSLGEPAGSMVVVIGDENDGYGDDDGGERISVDSDEDYDIAGWSEREWMTLAYDDYLLEIQMTRMRRRVILFE